MTYTAAVRVPKPLTALMSAVSEDGVAQSKGGFNACVCILLYVRVSVCVCVLVRVCASQTEWGCT